MSNDHDIAAALAKTIAMACVRNTCLEELHTGRSPDSKTGDYSDVKVVTPYGEIPWNEVSRLGDDEMKRLMQEIVNKLYTFLLHQGDLRFLEGVGRYAAPYVRKWDEPKLDDGFMLFLKK